MKSTTENIKPHLNTSKWIKLLVGLLLIVVVTVGSLFVLGFLLEEKVKSVIITEINKKVTVPVKVDGGIKLSLLKHFPNASLTFSQVSIDDKLVSGNKKLIAVEELSLLCNIFSLWSNEVEFNRILIRNGEVNLLRNAKGKWNYAIFKEDTSDKSSSLAVKLRKVDFKRVKFTYSDKLQHTHLNFFFDEAQMQGNFSETNFTLDTKARFTINKFSSQDDFFLEGKKVNTNFVLDVNRTTGKYRFKEGNIRLDEVNFAIDGFFATRFNETELDFTLKNDGADMQQLFSLMPARYSENFIEAKGSGAYSLEATVKGILGKSSMPDVVLKAELRDSEIKLGKYNKFLKNVNAKATYSVDKKGRDLLQISNFNCTLNDKPFQFKLLVNNLSDPSFDLFANGTLHLAELSSFVSDTIAQDIDGTILFNQFHLVGRKSDFTDIANSSLVGSGQFKLNGIEFRQNDITYGNINGLLKYENDRLEAQNLTLNMLSTDFTFSGDIQNLFPFIYNLSENRTANKVVLDVNGKLKMKNFHLSALIDAFDKKKIKDIASKKQKLNIAEVFNMRGNLEVSVEQFTYLKMKFEELNASLQISPGLIRINQLNTVAMGGDVQTKGLISFINNKDLNINCDISAVGLDLPIIFQQADNFGQTTLTDKNLKGKLTSAMSLNATWKDYKTLDQESLTAIIDFSIKEGRLLNFEPLKAASKFIRVSELEDVRFAELTNTIKIANKRFDVPEFEIKTSALNLMFFGYHYFDNTVDYHLKVNLHKLLAQKFNRNNNADLQYIESDPYEGVNIYLSLLGPIDSLKIKYDKASSRNKLKEDFKKEKDVLKNLLNNSPIKVDENEKKREEKYFDTQSPPEFIDFDDKN